MKRWGIIGLLVLTSALAACAGGEYGTTPAPSPSPSNSDNQVTIENFAFNPAEVRIQAGETVTWINRDNATHTATGDTWDSGDINSGEKYTMTFIQPGTYDYICRYHPSMQGMVVVTQ